MSYWDAEEGNIEGQAKFIIIMDANIIVFVFRLSEENQMKCLWKQINQIINGQKISEYNKRVCGCVGHTSPHAQSSLEFSTGWFGIICSFIIKKMNVFLALNIIISYIISF